MIYLSFKSNAETHVQSANKFFFYRREDGSQIVIEDLPKNEHVKEFELHPNSTTMISAEH